MIRFRNPSSSLETMLESFDELYSALHEQNYFTNDDIARVLAEANLMASSGFVGGDAVSLGANKDKSRDKTYNNAKMFAEIYRLLGLISSVGGVSSNYRFTYIGEHLVMENVDKKAITEQCILGMNNPNKIINVSYNEHLRFFSCVLKTMKDLDGYICRDEMIIGPMCVNDNEPEEYNGMILKIKRLRQEGNHENLIKELEKLAKSLKSNKKSGMSVTSVRNCTRFPISVLKYCGWVTLQNKKIYGKSVSFMVLTDHGRNTIKTIEELKDVRLDDYESATNEQKKALIRLGTYQMLARANFSLRGLENEIKDDKRICYSIIDNKDVLFSPFQTITFLESNSALGILEIDFSKTNDEINHIKTYTNRLKIKSNRKINLNKSVETKNKYWNDNVEKFLTELDTLYSKNKDTDVIVEELVKRHINDKKTEFYPLIETLFKIIGVDCHKSRDGVNGERWDAMIRDSKRSIPIEIKSPTEELNVSIKAVRQALENKIILLSRESYKTTVETSSFVVGYFLPNERAEVTNLISDIKETYGVIIAVFDLASLIKIATTILIFKKGINIEELYEVEGLVDGESFTYKG